MQSFAEKLKAKSERLEIQCSLVNLKEYEPEDNFSEEVGVPVVFLQVSNSTQVYERSNNGNCSLVLCRKRTVPLS